MLTKVVCIGLRNGPGFVASALGAITLPPHRYEGMKVCKQVKLWKIAYLSAAEWTGSLSVTVCCSLSVRWYSPAAA